jgi:hypothetical protein
VRAANSRLMVDDVGSYTEARRVATLAERPPCARLASLSRRCAGLDASEERAEPRETPPVCSLFVFSPLPADSSYGPVSRMYGAVKPAKVTE